MSNSLPLAAKYQCIRRASADAPWLVMVHGVSQNHRVFDRQVEVFESDYRIILIDLPGHGWSSELDGPYGLSEYALSIAETLADAEITDTHFWGTHLGAGAGLLLATSSPMLFKSLILEAPVFPGRRLPSVNDLLGKIATVAQQSGMAEARKVWWQQGKWFDVMRARPLECRAAEQQAIIDDFEGRPWLDSGLASAPIPAIDQSLAELRVPVLIVNGEHDLQDFLDAAESLSELLPFCDRASIANAGGFPLWEFPDATNTIAQQFFMNARRTGKTNV